MVYCNYISNTTDEVHYAYGGTTQDISGEVVFNFNEEYIEILKEPDNSNDEILEKYLSRLYNKNKPDFIKGIFKKKLSYEI